MFQSVLFSIDWWIEVAFCFKSQIIVKIDLCTHKLSHLQQMINIYL